MNNASNKKIEILKQHLGGLELPSRPRYLQYLDKKLPPNHPRIKILEEMF
ncbi:hypothetical protein NGI46_17585 [Peribacillus butanolivorans]|nr:hypothetical protein [Peribacillus butanolivorans]MCO0599225.1 hypothetical protein [Peribacillus butanolivorans]